MAKNKDGWFFKKKLIDEINSVPDEMIYGDESVKAKEKDSFVLEANKNPEKPNESQSTEPVKEMMEEVDKQTLEGEKRTEEMKEVKEQGLKESVEATDISTKDNLGQVDSLHSTNQKLERQVTELMLAVQRSEKEKQTLREEKEAIILKLQEVENAYEQQVKKNDTLLKQPLEKITELTEQNEQLKKDVQYAQQEIGEVLLTAKKQASRILEEAQMEADHLIRTANLELESISNKAHKISIEVEESKDTVTSLYMELQNKVRQLQQEIGR